MPEYRPEPIDTSHVKLSNELLELNESLARNAHEIWATERLAEGWRFGAQRDDANKLHPCLVPYEELPESEKEYDRKIVLLTLQALLAMGYRIDKT